ncbi:hypothetical protein GFK91_31305 (plasmid) [Roseibium aggregatum]|uniref:hypothetical protein n=1 Tax=Roseibium aggregatum TaxID=187304 RepID=UPI001E32C0D3|nr:hypothetical protein [Roseibium aggregatum]UES60209.1 hypothetical protein GFK91_31305 [Roseibium aggregatum]
MAGIQDPQERSSVRPGGVQHLALADGPPGEGTATNGAPGLPAVGPRAGKQAESQGHAWSILLAAVLFLLGEKSLVLAQFGLRIYEGEPSKDAAAFEIALAGLAVGTAAVVFLTVMYRDVAKKDAVAIITGLVIATLAALINIGEAVWIKPLTSNPQIVYQALFFFALWLLLLPLPYFTSVIVNGTPDGRPLKLLATIALALVFAAIVGAVFRFFSGLLLFEAFPNPAAEHREAAFDRLQFEPDMLIMLGSTWIAATFLPRCGLPWRLVYAALAPICGYGYGALLTNNSFSWILAYAVLSAAALLPCLLLWPSTGWPTRKRLCLIVVLTCAACAVSMYFGFARPQHLSGAEQITLSLLQGLAGVLLVVCAVAAFKFTGKYLKWQPFPKRTARRSVGDPKWAAHP